MTTESIDNMLERFVRDTPRFQTALRAAMEHGLGAEDETPWSNERLGQAMTPNEKTIGVNRSTVASWLHPDVEARKAISAKNAARLFQVMGRLPLSPERLQILENLREAYIADFPERNPDPVAQIVDTCKKLSRTHWMEAQKVASDKAQDDVATVPHDLAASVPGSARKREAWHIFSAIGVLAAVITAALAAFQYFEPGSGTPSTTVTTGDGSSVNVGNGTQINIGDGATVGATSNLLDELTPDARIEDDNLEEK